MDLVHRYVQMRGSSPLTRGKPQDRMSRAGRLRLIPAHAGKTRRPCGRSRGSRAHPRSRGENSSDATPAKDSVGSSPLTRGKRVRFRARRPGGGLIPAHAGKTPSLSPRLSLDGAHPRSRGENLKVSALPPATAGSSPLTRGKRTPALMISGRFGLIPAHAGKTVLSDEDHCGHAAHPRSRGENC